MKNKKINKNFSMIIKFVSIVFCLVTVTFSWFVFSKEGWINPFDVNISKVISVQISSDKVNWTDKLEINEDSSNYGTFTEFSGNGDKMYIPIISNKTITGFYKPDYSNREKDYIEIDTYIQTDSPINLFLSPESKITPSDPTCYEDNIAGAVRVAFLLKNEHGQLIKKPMIWAPNSTYQYISESDVDKEGQVEDSYSYIYKENNDTFVETTDLVEIPTKGQASGISDDKYFMWGDLTNINKYYEEALPLFTVANVDGSTIVKLTIAVWVEGQDREAQASLIGGKVKMNLKFNGVEIK